MLTPTIVVDENSAIGTGSLQIKPGPSEASQCSLRSGLSLSFLLQRLLLRPSLLLLLLLPILLQLLHLLTNLFLFLQKLTLRGCWRRANAVFRVASDQTQLPEAVRSKPMQSSGRPPDQRNIPSLNVNGGRSRQANAVFGVPPPLPTEQVHVQSSAFWLTNVSAASTTSRSVSHTNKNCCSLSR